MCRTSAPPRRDLYELSNELRANEGPFFVPPKRVERLNQSAWRSNRRTVYNANYSADGHQLLQLQKPWTVLSPIDFQAFHTHAEAVAWAFKEKK